MAKPPVVNTPAAPASGIVAFKGSAVGLQGLAKGLSKVVAAAPRALTHPLLRLLKSGRWVFGQANVPVSPQDVWAVNPFSIQHGYCCWTRYAPEERRKDELLGEVMVDFTEDKPDRNSLQSYSFPWTDQVSCELSCIAGPNKGTEVLYKVGSVGGMRAISGLMAEIGERAEAGDPCVVPLLTLQLDSYQHKNYGETFVPILEPHEWVDMNLNASGAPTPPPAPTPAPAAAAPVRRRARA